MRVFAKRLGHNHSVRSWPRRQGLRPGARLGVNRRNAWCGVGRTMLNNRRFPAPWLLEKCRTWIFFGTFRFSMDRTDAGHTSWRDCHRAPALALRGGGRKELLNCRSGCEPVSAVSRVGKAPATTTTVAVPVVREGVTMPIIRGIAISVSAAIRRCRAQRQAGRDASTTPAAAVPSPMPSG